VRVVVDAGPLISLARIGHLDLLLNLFGEVVVPAVVRQEVTGDQGLPGAAAVAEAKWLKTAEASNLVAVERLMSRLSAGESEVLVLAQELGATAVIDERRGRGVATALGIAQTGTIGVLLAAKRAGLIASVRPLLDQLSAAGVHLSPRLHDEALRLADEM
jgi:predicted nucleic acid-binding protein